MLGKGIKNAKASIDTRLNDPVFFSFVISWCIWNYKTIIVIISSEPAHQKFLLIDTVLYPDISNYLFYALGLPLGSALVYLLGYPHFTLFIQKHWRALQVKIENQKNEIERTETIPKGLYNALCANIAETPALC